MSPKKIVLAISLAFVGVLSGIVLISQDVDAVANTKTAILEKAAFYGLGQCYYNNKNIKSSIELGDYLNGSSIVSTRGSHMYSLPTGFTRVDGVNCDGLLNGKSNFGGLYGVAKTYGQSNPSVIPPTKNNLADVATFLQGMGYSSGTGTGDGKCTIFTWDAKYSGDTTGVKEEPATVTMCAELNGDKFASDAKLDITYSHYGSKIVEFEARKGELQLDCEVFWPTHGGCSSHSYKKGDSYSAFRAAVLADLSENATAKNNIQLIPGVTGNFTLQTPTDAPYTPSSAEFSLGDEAVAFGKALKYLSNNTYKQLSDLKLDQTEQATLLQTYLTDFYGMEVATTDSGSCNISGDQLNMAKNNGSKEARIYYKGSFQKCWVRATKNNESKVSAYDINNGATKNYFTGVKIGFGDIVGRLNNLTISTLPDGALSEPVTSGAASGATNSEGTDGDEDIQSPCTLAGGPLSWILCPAMSVMGAAVEGLYSWIENQFLSIDANLYSNSSETYNAWKNFQSYANIFFIILLVFVIISQVTGFGISNYGIKKTLPKLVIAIILINISFFVCQMAVDLSNILGSSIKELFDGMAGDISTANLGTSIGAVVSYVVGAGELTGLAIGAFSIAHLIPSTFETWMIPFILTLIACVLGVIFFFIILCVRQAAVIVLIVLAPLAIAAYALPNTKKIFERWFKLFTALLLVYPICGLLMGGGNFVSRLLMEGAADGEGGFGMILIALLANVIPFFLIPGILRSSMAGLGNLGAKIAGFNDRLNRRIGRAVTTSEAVKEAQRQAVKNRNLARYERLNSGKGVRQRVARGLRRMGRTDAADSLERRSKRDMARSWSAYSRVQNDDNDIEEMAENINPDSIEARRMTRRREFADQQINDLANLMALGDVRYTDSTGASIKINADDVGSLENAHMHYMRQAELATDEATRKANTQRAQAVQQLLFAKGDTGRSKAMRNLYDHVFGDGTSTNPGYQKSETARDMFSRISADGKAMAALKNEDPGSFNLTNDMMGDGNLLSRQTYELPKAEKITAGNVAQLSDNYYDNLERNDNYKSLSDDEIKSLDNIFTRAFTDERLSANLKNKDNATRVMNKIREEAHERRVADWIGKNPGKTRADYEAQSGTFQKLAAGDTMKVPHERTRKAAMPGDWRRDPLNGNRWTEYKSGVPHRVLNVQETRRANAIEAQNIQADIDNEVNR